MRLSPRPEIICILIILLFSAVTNRIHAAPAYGTDMPKKNNIIMGYQTNLLFKHRFKNSQGGIKSAQDFLDISYGVYDWFSFDGKLGVGNTFQDGGDFPVLHYGASFAGGYGFRILLFENSEYKTKAVFGFHHISVHPADAYKDGNKTETFLDDWQFDLLGSKKIAFLNPYIGFKAAEFNQGYRVNRGDKKRKFPRYHGGTITGCNVKFKKDIFLNIEGRFIDETALNCGIYYSF